MQAKRHQIRERNQQDTMLLTKTDITHSEVNLAAAHDEIQECILLYDLKE